MVEIAVEFREGSDAMSIHSLFYERRASTLANPVPAGATDYQLFYYEKTVNIPLQIVSLGTDQHDNSVYKWYIDGNLVASISGAAAVGSILKPYVFPRPIRVDQSIELKIDNLNGKAYPNDTGLTHVDRVPYECVVSGVWG